MPLEIPDIGNLYEGWSQHHEAFDADLVGFSKSNWGRSNMEADPNIVFADIREFTRRRMVEHLRAVPELKLQDFSDQRMIFHHLAHRATVLSGDLLHASGLPEEVWIEQMRQSLHFIAQDRSMVARDDRDPISSHWKAKPEHFEVGGKMTHLKTLKVDAKDQAIAWHFLGKVSAPKMDIAFTRARLMEAMPFLVEVDDTNIEYRLLDIRTELLKFFEGKLRISAHDKKAALAMLADHWAEKGPGATSMHRFELMIEEIFEEWSGDENPLDIDHDPVDRILDLAFSKLIQADAPTLDGTDREKALDRKLLLEFLLMREAEIASKTNDYNTGTIDAIARQYERYHKALGLRFGDMAYLDLAVALIGASSPEKLKEMLH